LQQTVTKNPPTPKSNVSAGKSGANGHDVPESVNDLEVELGIWLASIESYLGTTAQPFAEKMNSRSHDWSGELNLTNSGFIICSRILTQMSTLSAAGEASTVLSSDDLDDLSDTVCDLLSVSEGLSRAKPLGYAEWRAWCRMAVGIFHTTSAFGRLVDHAEKAAEQVVPERLKELMNRDTLPFGDRFDLGVIVPGFARVLRILHVIERLLDTDDPLKPSLLVFARVYEDTHELVGHINRRLLRFSDEDAELFRALDSASYIASIELRKVFDQELSGLISVKSAITVYARVETAFASLRDNIQQILAGIAKLIEPETDAADVFPIIGHKLHASVKLRSELATMIKLVRNAEQDPKGHAIADEKLKAFLAGPIPSLFYKDRESVERFVEEILRTRDRKDLVPILHRFGAYLETLFGHVNNRTVLRDHPFEQ
jgi:hypothetical protein